MNDFDRFRLALSQITGKRLTYKYLTGKDMEPPPRDGQLKRQNRGKRKAG